jgi:hypothetical protein
LSPDLLEQPATNNRPSGVGNHQPRSLHLIEPCIRNAKLKDRLRQQDSRSVGLKPHHPSDFWKITSQFGTVSLVVTQSPGKGFGLFYLPSKENTIPTNAVVFSETGINGHIDDFEFAAVLLSTKVELFYDKRVLQTLASLESPFAGVSNREFQQATAMAKSNYFSVSETKRVLFNVASRLNHSCEPNLVRSHTKSSQGMHRITLKSTRPINPGDELSIQYSPLSGHEERDFFDCRCDLTLYQRGGFDQDEMDDEDYVLPIRRTKNRSKKTNKVTPPE